MDQVNITYLGHSCFCLEANGYRTVIDPYIDGMVPGLPPLRVEAEAVYCSHQHDDHNYVQAVRREETTLPAPYTVEEWITPHDAEGGKRRGMNTVRIFHFGQLRIAHLGDIGRPLTAGEREKLLGVDCLLIPVGGYYTIDARQAKEMAEEIGPKVIIPMHYRTASGGFPEIALLDQFTKLYPQVRQGGSTLVLTRRTPAQVLVLSPAESVPRLRFSASSQPALSDLVELYQSAGWVNYTPALLEAAYANSLNVFTAWGGSRLVGVLRAVGDGASIVYLQDLLVLDSYRRQGIGSALLAQALEQYATVYQVVLLTDSTPSTRAFYGQAGLTEAEQLGCTAFVRFAKPNQI